MLLPYRMRIEEEMILAHSAAGAANPSSQNAADVMEAMDMRVRKNRL